MEPGQLRGEVEDADAGDHRREGLPHSVHAGAGDVHRVAAARDSIATAGEPEREPLGAEAEELAAMVWGSVGLDGEVDGEVGAASFLPIPHPANEYHPGEGRGPIGKVEVTGDCP